MCCAMLYLELTFFLYLAKESDVLSRCMEQTLFNRNGVLVTNSRIVFKETGGNNTIEELTFFVPHVSSVKMVAKTITPTDWGLLLIILGVLTVFGSLLAFGSVSQGSNEELGSVIFALVIGIIFVIHGIWLRRTRRVREDYSVAIHTSGGEVKVLLDVDSDDEFASQVVAAVTRAVMSQPATSPK